VDKLGFITQVQCLMCGNQLSATCRKSKYRLERISDESVLERGDHVAWYRPTAYYHHGIVTRQQVGRVAVVGYTLTNRFDSNLTLLLCRFFVTLFLSLLCCPAPLLSLCGGFKPGPGGTDFPSFVATHNFYARQQNASCVLTIV